MSAFETRQRAANANLLDYANKVRDQRFLNDVIIVAGNERIPANRLVLSCYSTYFEEMFNFQERNFKKVSRKETENIIEIQNVDGKALKALIDFIYTGCITISEHKVTDLLLGADRLKLYEVKQFCVEFLCTHITVQNSLYILKTIILYGNTDQRNQIQQYISTNFDEVLQTDDFKQLSNEELISCLSILDRSQVEEFLIFQAIVAWTKHDEEARKTCFPGLFTMVQIEKVSLDYFANFIFKEELVIDIIECFRIAFTTFRTLVKKRYTSVGAAQKEIQHYISINIDQILHTDDFKQLSNEELISCLSILDRNQVEESLIFQIIIAWTKHDEEARKTCFPGLFTMVQLQKVSLGYFANFIFEEELVTNTIECLKVALTTFRMLVTKPQASKLLSLGGVKNSTFFYEVAVIYNLSDVRSISYPDLPEKVYSFSSLTLNDFIYCIGGKKPLNNNAKTDSVWRLNFSIPNSGWEKVASMKTKREAMGAAVHGDVIVVVGGRDENNQLLASVEVYHYQTSFNKWRTISALKHQRYGHALVSCDGYLYAIGGWDGHKSSSSVEQLDDLEGEWINIEPMQTPRTDLAAVNCDGMVYAVGGRSGDDYSKILKTVEKYDSSANKWKFVSNMNIERRAHAACVLRNKIYVVGGLDAKGKVVKEIECYEPAHDTWSIVENATEKLHYHTLVAV